MHIEFFGKKRYDMMPFDTIYILQKNLDNRTMFMWISGPLMNPPLRVLQSRGQGMYCWSDHWTSCQQHSLILHGYSTVYVTTRLYVGK